MLTEILIYKLDKNVRIAELITVGEVNNTFPTSRPKFTVQFSLFRI